MQWNKTVLLLSSVIPNWNLSELTTLRVLLLFRVFDHHLHRDHHEVFLIGKGKNCYTGSEMAIKFKIHGNGNGSSSVIGGNGTFNSFFRYRLYSESKRCS